MIKVAFVFNRQRNKTLEEAEFDTLEVISAITEALKKKYEVVQIEVDRNALWVRKLEQCKPDIILNTAEGYRGMGRESLAPICFEQLGLHYAGPGPYQCFLTLDKFLTKQVVAAGGVPVPEGILIQNMENLSRISTELIFPVFAKPNFEGSSKGITRDSLCENAKDLEKYLNKNLSLFPEGAIVERYVQGTDITVPFLSGLGDEGVLEPVEYYRPGKSEEWIYDYNLKNHDDSEVHVRCPAHLDRAVISQIVRYMKQVVRSLSIVDIARADFRVTPTGEVYFIEINALPSLQPGAGIFEASSRLGMNYAQTIQHIVESALSRKKTQPPTKTPRKTRTRKPNVALVYNVKTKRPHEPGYELESEFDSLDTIKAIGDAIVQNGYPLEYLEMSRNLADDLISSRIDVVFNIAEGFNRRTREAQVPALCDMLGIEHTGSDATCLALTLDKATTTKLVSIEGIKVPRSRVIYRLGELSMLKLSFPVIAKPNFEGTSKGIYERSVATNQADLESVVKRIEELLPSGVLIEEYIEGREFTVGLLGSGNPKVIGPSEFVFKDRKDEGITYPVYSFEAKQEDNPMDNKFFRVECPADLSLEMIRKIKAFAKKCYRTAGCRDVCRIDFRMTAKGELYFIEMNPLPGLSPGFSDLSILAEKSGMSYPNLIGSILKPAVQRWRRKQTSILGNSLYETL